VVQPTALHNSRKLQKLRSKPRLDSKGSNNFAHSVSVASKSGRLRLHVNVLLLVLLPSALEQDLVLLVACHH
jgi:hypothetical protein